MKRTKQKPRYRPNGRSRDTNMYIVHSFLVCCESSTSRLLALLLLASRLMIQTEAVLNTHEPAHDTNTQNTHTWHASPKTKGATVAASAKKNQHKRNKAPIFIFIYSMRVGPLSISIRWRIDSLVCVGCGDLFSSFWLYNYSLLVSRGSSLSFHFLIFRFKICSTHPPSQSLCSPSPSFSEDGKKVSSFFSAEKPWDVSIALFFTPCAPSRVFKMLAKLLNLLFLLQRAFIS